MKSLVLFGSFLLTRAVGFHVGVLLRSGKDVEIARSLNNSVLKLIRQFNWLRWNKTTDAKLILKYRWIENTADTNEIMLKLCELATDEGAGAIIGPPDEAVATLAGPLIDELLVPYFNTWTGNMEGDTNHKFRIDMFPMNQSRSLQRKVLTELEWTGFTYVYRNQKNILHWLLDKNIDHMRLVGVDGENFVQAARTIANFSYQCFGIAQCQYSRRVFIDLSPEDTMNLFFALLKVGLINNNYWYMATQIQFPAFEYSWFNENQARISVVQPTLNTTTYQYYWGQQVTYKTDENQTPLHFLHKALATDALVLIAHAYKEVYDEDNFKNIERFSRFGAHCYYPMIPKDLVSFLETTEFSLNYRKPKLYAFGEDILGKIPRMRVNGTTGPIRFIEKQRQSLSRANISFSLMELGRSGKVQKTGDLMSNGAIKWLQNICLLRNDSFESHDDEERPYLMYDNSTGQYEYKGFLKDVLDLLAKDLKFTYQLHLVEDKQYGSKHKGEWNGMIREILDGKAQMAVAPLTITFERSQAVDFTAPILQHGVSMLLRKPKEELPNYSAFLFPLHLSLWLAILGAIVMAISAMFLVAQCTPSERRPCPQLHNVARPHLLINGDANQNESGMDESRHGSSVHSYTRPLAHPERMESNGGLTISTKNDQVTAAERWLERRESVYCIFSLANTLWYMCCILFRAGCEFSPMATSTRLLSGIFWVFTLVVISTYTAKFAAVLTVERRGSPINSFEELGNQTEYDYGVLEGGSTALFLRESQLTVFNRLWDHMKKRESFVKSNNAGVARALESKYVYLMESTTLEYEVMQNCNLTQVADMVLGSKGYGIALKKGSKWRDKISQKILEYADNGLIAKFKNIWWKKFSMLCPNKGSSSVKTENKALVFKQLAGPFLLLSLGGVIAIFVAFGEFLWTRNQFTPLQKRKNSMIVDMLSQLYEALKGKPVFHSAVLQYSDNCPDCNTMRNIQENSQRLPQEYCPSEGFDQEICDAINYKRPPERNLRQRNSGQSSNFHQSPQREAIQPLANHRPATHRRLPNPIAEGNMTLSSLV